MTLSLEKFIEQFVDYKSYASTHRDIARSRADKKQAISQDDLISSMQGYWNVLARTMSEIQRNDVFGAKDFDGYLANNAIKADKTVEAVSGKERAIALFKTKCGENVVVHNGSTFAKGAVGTLVGAFGAAAATMFALKFFGIAVFPVFVSLLPVLAALGPVGGLLVAAAAMAVATLAIYGLATAITALATGKTVDVRGAAPSDSEEEEAILPSSAASMSALNQVPANDGKAPDTAELLKEEPTIAKSPIQPQQDPVSATFDKVEKEPEQPKVAVKA